MQFLYIIAAIGLSAGVGFVSMQGAFVQRHYEAEFNRVEVYQQQRDMVVRSVRRLAAVSPGVIPSAPAGGHALIPSSIVERAFGAGSGYSSLDVIEVRVDDRGRVQSRIVADVPGAGTWEPRFDG